MSAPEPATPPRATPGSAQQASHPLDRVLRPSSIAIIGASPDPTKRGHQAVRALLDAKYAGRILPVHPAGGELLGLPVVRSAADLDSPPDLVLVCTPAATVPSVLEEWGRAGASGAVILASGFAETGEGGASIETALLKAARETGIRVIGPNTSGIMNVPLGVNLIGIRGVRAGSLALLVQSGNITLQLVTEATMRSGQGFSFCIGTGNKADLRFWEYLEFLEGDTATRAIMMHIEGFRDGRRFLETARKVSQVKPIVMLKGARTAAGGESARSHTGAIAGSYDVLRAGLRQAGVIEVRRTDELFHVADTLATQPPVEPGRGIALLCDGGGHATLAMDALHDRGAPVAHLSADTRDRLRSLLGRSASVANPIDLAGAADRAPLVFARTLEILAADPAVGAILVVGLFGGYAVRFAESLLDAEIEAAAGMASAARATRTALIVHSLFAQMRTRPLVTLSSNGVPVVESLDVACACAAAIVERGAVLARLAGRPDLWAARHSPDSALDAARGAQPPDGRPGPDLITAALAEGRSVLLEVESRAVLEATGVPLVAATFCTSDVEAASAADTIAGPVAIRVVSPAAPHKTEAGGVVLNVEGGVAAAAAYDRIATSLDAFAAARDLSPDMRGVLVSPMQRRPIAELLVGVLRDDQFGPVLTVGAGGTAVETLRDVSLRVLPVNADEIREMLGELRIWPQLEGLRGRDGANIDAIVAAALAVATAALSNESIGEIEVNPLFAYSDGCVALDARTYLMRRND